MIYYFVLGYRKEIDKQYKRHLHPCYLTSYDLKLGGSGFGLQSGIYDALKFETYECAKYFMDYAIKKFDNYEFEIAPFSSDIFGKYRIDYIIPFDYNNDFYYIIQAIKKDDDFINFVCNNNEINSSICNSLKFECVNDANERLKTLNDESYDFKVVPYNKKYFGKEIPQNIIKTS